MRLTTYARENRRRATPEETTVWRWLRDRRFGAWKFRRQHTLGGYIADFYCAELKLAIELDGRQHGESFYDVDRDIDLAKIGVTVLRIPNAVVRDDPTSAADRIIRAIQSLLPAAGGEKVPRSGG